ncbi:MAG: NAD(P)H-binding protein [Halobacteriales archaeon]|nr:NAD(P)H-binding protein [Halobacteriales archaeon]
MPTATPVAMVRPASSTARLPEGVATVEGDLSDPDSLAAAMDGVDSVVHLAAAVYDAAAMAATNVAGTERLVEAAADADVDRFVFLEHHRRPPGGPGGRATRRTSSRRSPPRSCCSAGTTPSRWRPSTRRTSSARATTG